MEGAEEEEEEEVVFAESREAEWGREEVVIRVGIDRTVPSLSGLLRVGNTLEEKTDPEAVEGLVVVVAERASNPAVLRDGDLL